MTEAEFNEDEVLEEIKKKRQEQQEKQEAKNELTLAGKIENSVAQYYDNTIANNGEKMQALTDKLFGAEVEVKEKQIEGRKEVLKAQTDKEVTKAKTEVDTEKTERSKTILKAQGLTEKLPPAFRVTALIVGYPFFLLYLLTLGWVIQFVTFVIKGFITMVFDCADRYMELNKKFEKDENKFNLGKAIFNILKYALLITGVILLIVFLRK